MRQFSRETQRHRENGGQTDPRTSVIIAPAIEVHRELGPGLFESAYEEGLCHALRAGRSLSLGRLSYPFCVRNRNLTGVIDWP